MFDVRLDQAQAEFPEFEFVKRLTPSAQKAAFHVRDGEVDLCLKIFSPECNPARVEREIHALEALDSANVVKLVKYVFSFGAGHSKHYCIEEYVEGCDLADILVEGECWPVDRVVKIFIGLAAGLSAIGEKQIVHRDLKPTNIRIRTNDEPVIIDFGVARHLDLSDLTPTPLGAGIGTIPYYAPEQFVGTKRDIDQRTDLFAFGEILHQALVGYHPFFRTGMTEADLREAVCKENAFAHKPLFSKLPKHWRVLIKSLLAKD